MNDVTRTSKELTPEQEARAREIREDCRQLPGWASREIVRLQDRERSGWPMRRRIWLRRNIRCMLS
jgi:hypothetical protein